MRSSAVIRAAAVAIAVGAALVGCTAKTALPVGPTRAAVPAPAYTLSPPPAGSRSSCGPGLALIVAGKAPAISAPLGCAGAVIQGSYSPTAVTAAVGESISSWTDDGNGSGTPFHGALSSSAPSVVAVDGTQLKVIGAGTADIALSSGAPFICNPKGGGSLPSTDCPLWRITAG